MPYKFNRVAPPLLADVGGDVIGIPADQLREVVGTADWSTKAIGPPGVGIVVISTDSVSQFQLLRTRRWVISDPPVHYAQDKTLEVTIVKGYSQQEKQSMSESLGVSVGAEAFGLKADVKATLQITDDTSREWHEQETQKTTTKFDAGFTYVTWSLLDSLDLIKATTITTKANGSVVSTQGPIVSTDHFDCVISVYGDRAQLNDAAVRKVTETISPHDLALIRLQLGGADVGRLSSNVSLGSTISVNIKNDTSNNYIVSAYDQFANGSREVSGSPFSLASGETSPDFEVKCDASGRGVLSYRCLNGPSLSDVDVSGGDTVSIR